MEENTDVHSKVSNVSEHISKQVVDSNLGNPPKTPRISKLDPLPVEKVRSALRLLSEVSYKFPKYVKPEVASADIDVGVRTLRKLSMEQFKTNENNKTISRERYKPDEIFEDYMKTFITQDSMNTSVEDDEGKTSKTEQMNFREKRHTPVEVEETEEVGQTKEGEHRTEQMNSSAKKQTQLKVEETKQVGERKEGQHRTEQMNLGVKGHTRVEVEQMGELGKIKKGGQRMEQLNLVAKEGEVKETKGEGETEKGEQRVGIPKNDGIEEVFKADEPDVKDMLDFPRKSKGICFEIAQNPDIMCKKGICEPSPQIKQEKSEIGVNYKMTKKICRRENETGMLSCLNRLPATKERKFGIETKIDTPHCVTVIETTIFKTSPASSSGKINEVVERPVTPSTIKKLEAAAPAAIKDTEKECPLLQKKEIITKDDEIPTKVSRNDDEEIQKGELIETSLTSGKIDEVVEIAVIPSTIKKLETAATATVEDTRKECVPFDKEKIITVDAEIPKAEVSRKYDREIQKGEMCECCQCAICECNIQQTTNTSMKRLIIDESPNIEVKKFKDLQSVESGRARNRMVTKYSWDTIKVPNPWEFAKDQEELRKAEREELIARAEKIKKERKEALAAFASEVGVDDAHAESIENSETERVWEAYKAVEWAGLRHEYTEDVKSIDLEELNSISWTSQPPPELLVGTFGKRDAKVVPTSTVVDLGPIEERKQSFIKVDAGGVKLRMNRSKAAISEQGMDRRRRYMLESKKEIGMKRRRDVKKELDDETKVGASVKSEQRREFYDSYIPVSQRTSNDRPSKKNVGDEIDERLLPMRLKEEADIWRKSGIGQTESTASRKILNISKSLPADDAARLIALHSLDDLSPAHSCPCLPGYCTCERKHWTFLKSKSMENFLDRNAEKVYGDKIKRTDSDAGIYTWDEFACPCSHSYDEIQSSEESEDFIVATQPSPRKSEEITCPCKKRYGQTVLIVKPDAMIFEDVIRRALIYTGGLHIVNERRIRLSPEQVSEVYAKRYYGSESYPLFVLRMSRMPVLVLSVVGLNVLEVVQSIMGNDKLIPESWFLPESIKRRIMIPENLIDGLHITEDAEQSSIETTYFFPQMLIEPIPTIPSRITDFCRTYLDPTLSKGLAAVARTKPVDPIIFLAEWLLTHNPFQPWYKPHQINLVPT